MTDGCITCPWHGSRFRLDDGSVVVAFSSVPDDASEQVRALAAGSLASLRIN